MSRRSAPATLSSSLSAGGATSTTRGLPSTTPTVVGSYCSRSVSQGGSVLGPDHHDRRVLARQLRAARPRGAAAPVPRRRPRPTAATAASTAHRASSPPRGRKLRAGRLAARRRSSPRASRRPSATRRCPSSRSALELSISTGVRKALIHSANAGVSGARSIAAATADIGGARHRHRRPAELAGEVGGGDLVRGGEVVDAGLALARDRRGDRRRDVVVCGRAETEPRCRGAPAAPPAAARARGEAAPARPSSRLPVVIIADQGRRVGAGDDRRAARRTPRSPSPRASLRAGSRARPCGPSSRSPPSRAAGISSVSQPRSRCVEAVGGDRRGVDEPPGAGGRGRLEDVARALEVDPVGLLVVAEDDEREVDDHVGVGDQALDRRRGRGCRRGDTRSAASRARRGRTGAGPCR